jgi:ESCRT-I complex subunit VPS37
MALRDELFALRDATAQSYAHAEALKIQWAEIEKAQASYYQVRNFLIDREPRLI